MNWQTKLKQENEDLKIQVQILRSKKDYKSEYEHMQKKNNELENRLNEIYVSAQSYIKVNQKFITIKDEYKNKVQVPKDQKSIKAMQYIIGLTMKEENKNRSMF